ncbi:MAG: glycoside hydrolase family 76 protein [Flavisolibacter sp.]
MSCMSYKKFTFLLIIIITAVSPFVYSQQAKDNKAKGYYKMQMIQLQQAIEDNFYDQASGFYKETAVVEKGKNLYSYLWPLCSMIQANNEIEKVNTKEGLVLKTMKIIQEYYDTSLPAPGYASYIMKFKGGDRFYDDNQWIGIACMDAYFRDKKKSCLQTGKIIYKYMMTGFDTVLNGGLYWQENKKTSKNTCSNGPGIILALQLYKATKERSYLDTAILLYNWVNEKLKAPNGLFYDNINVKANKIGKAMFSYNTGTMLQSNVYLYELTGQEKYFNEAVSIADSALNYFYGTGKFRDSYWFNAVLLRGYQHLLQHKKDTKYIIAFKECTDNALENNMNNLKLMGNDKALDLVSQSGMLEILARLAYLETKHNL